MRELEHSLRTARDRSAEYDIAATIDAMAAIDGVDPALLRERDEIARAAEDQAAADAGADGERGEGRREATLTPSTSTRDP